MPAIAISGNTVDTGLWSPSMVTVTKAGNVRINGQPVITHGDTIPSHTRFLNPTHTNPTMQSSQSAIKVNGQNVIVDGDRASCLDSHTINAVSGNVNISEE